MYTQHLFSMYKYQECVMKYFIFFFYSIFKIQYVLSRKKKEKLGIHASKKCLALMLGLLKTKT